MFTYVTSRVGGRPVFVCSCGCTLLELSAPHGIRCTMYDAMSEDYAQAVRRRAEVAADAAWESAE